MTILITGAAGFIGFHVAQCLLARGEQVYAIDNLNDYYDVSLKEARLRQLKEHENFKFEKTDIADDKALHGVFDRSAPHTVIHLAAQAGVRYSLQNPGAYVRSNLDGFVNIIEACRQHSTPHLVYASSSSVYGANTKTPFSTEDRVDHPLSLYGATKRANELMAYTYNHLYGLAVTGLRFFTVYGPWGRPDMSYFKFTKNILEGKPVEVYNRGQHTRDFTYIDDIVDGVTRAMALPEKSRQNTMQNYRLFNLGNNKPVELMRFISILESLTGKKAVLNMLPMQPGDVETTCADIESTVRELGYAPATPLEQGLRNFVDWFTHYYGYNK